MMIAVAAEFKQHEAAQYVIAVPAGCCGMVCSYLLRRFAGAATRNSNIIHGFQ